MDYSGFLTLLALSVVVIAVAVGLLALGLLITGKSKIKPGACGRDPNKKQDDEECGKKAECGLCKKELDKK